MTATPDAGPGARVSIVRYVEWPDTDAAGHHHHTTVLRWVEAAEAELYERRGVLHLFGVVPRVRLEVNHRARLWFRDRVDVSLRVARLGRTSVTHEFTVHRGDELAADGVLVAAHLDPAADRAAPWPDDVRRALSA